MSDNAVSDLIERYFDRGLAGEDRVRLERSLLDSPRARDLFWKSAAIHVSLTAWGRGHRGRTDARTLLSGLSPASRRRWFAGLRVVPTSVAASVSLLLVGLAAGTGIAWAMATGASEVSPRQIVIPLGNPGFEDPVGVAKRHTDSHVTLSQMISGPGEWFADAVRIATSEHGVTPFEGRRMLAFEQALPLAGAKADAPATSCDVVQFIDLQPYQDEIAGGEAMLEAAASFCDARTSRGRPIEFTVRLYVFAVAADALIESWATRGTPSIAMHEARFVSTGEHTPLPWTRLVSRVFVPNNAAIAMLTVSANEQNTEVEHARFDGQYVDNVAVALTIDDKSVRRRIVPTNWSSHAK